MHWERLLPPLTLSDFDKIWTVAPLHHVLPPSKISWHLDNVKMPKLDLKVENRQIEFLKNQLLCGDNAKLCRGGVNHDPKILWWLDHIKTQKLDSKVEFDISNFWKINFYVGTMLNYVGNGSTMTRKFMLGSLMIFKKKFSHFLPAKHAIMCKRSKKV